MWKICAFYSKNTRYEELSKKLIESLRRFNLNYDVAPIDDKGNWYANMQYKPTFLKSMLNKYPRHSIIYVDADAIICRYPKYFDKLDQESNVNIAVHVLDHTKFRRKHCAPEMLSGTIFLKNTPETNQIVDEWITECAANPKLWDQRALATVLRHHKYHLLPAEYCMIFDYMSSIENPVVKHFQASRESRRREQQQTNRRKNKLRSEPRVITNNGVVHIRRLNR
jgi:hypothetical protein